MKVLFVSFRNEWDKLLCRKKYLVFICIGVCICLLWTGLGQLSTDFVEQQGGYIWNFTPTPMGALPFFLRVLVPFLMFMGLTDLITIEGSENTMKAMICRPIERWKLYASKLLAVMAYAAVYLSCILIASTVLNQLFGKPLGVGEILTALASYALTLIPLTILACFGALVALLGKSGTLTMFILLLLYMLLNILPLFYPVLSEMLFTSYLGWYRIWIGILPATSKLIHVLLILLGYGTVFFMGGSLLFDRKEY